MLKNCSSCSVAIDRKDCHRNRHGEYICRSCQASGVKMTRRRQLQSLGKKVWVVISPIFLRIVLVVLGLLVLLKILIANDI